ncbi:hypothetical protein [Streptomyces sp. CB03911]|uniref:hypothetical protein n=1 Tax=Streptomyces sp. CB03911 TaxID=1804758 RepID=UPI00093D9B3A|nr:hypothetical protein [Streptomyces sp. CB03911]OKI19277.1 hypothetical protein A6A07_07185 [Streptomyces sp. CB03911]
MSPDATYLYRAVVTSSCTSLARPFQRKPYAAGHVFGPYDRDFTARAQRTVVRAAGGDAEIQAVYLDWGPVE